MQALVKKSVIAASIAAATLFAGAASAATFNPFNVVTPNGTAFTADKITGNYNETITFTGNTFSVSLRWDAGQFVTNQGATPLAAFQTGLGSNYGLYATYTATGTVTPMAGGATKFNFSEGSGALALYLDTNLLSTTDAGVLVATGNPITGEGNLDPNLSTCTSDTGGTGINCGSFGSTTSFALTPEGSSFFVSPNPFYTMSFQSGQLNNFTPSGTQTINGSLDVVFNGTSNAVPEPASLGLLGLGLLGLGAARRRKQKQA